VIGAIPFSGAVQEKGLMGETLDLTLPSMAPITLFVLQNMQK
jgi:hypothetical protein